MRLRGLAFVFGITAALLLLAACASQTNGLVPALTTEKPTPPTGTIVVQ